MFWWGFSCFLTLKLGQLHKLDDASELRYWKHAILDLLKSENLLSATKRLGFLFASTEKSFKGPKKQKKKRTPLFQQDLNDSEKILLSHFGP